MLQPAKAGHSTGLCPAERRNIYRNFWKSGPDEKSFSGNNEKHEGWPRVNRSGDNKSRLYYILRRVFKDEGDGYTVVKARELSPRKGGPNRGITITYSVDSSTWCLMSVHHHSLLICFDLSMDIYCMKYNLISSMLGSAQRRAQDVK